MAKKADSGSSNRYKFSEVADADLVVDAIYESGEAKNLSSVVLPKLIPGIGNLGGIRWIGKVDSTPLVVLFSNGSDPNWPDFLDPYRGTFHYYGDNRTPGVKVLERKGNRVLNHAFEKAHGTAEERQNTPVFLIFESIGEGHSAQFRGLAVPGNNLLQSDEDLVAIWRVSKGVRFQNYRAIFTILDEAEIDGSWIRDVAKNKTINVSDKRMPQALKVWMKSGTYKPLVAEELISARSQKEQTPDKPLAKSLIGAIREHCGEDDFLFEAIAVELWRMSINEPMDIDLTRRYRDGGRDAIGKVYIGPTEDPISLEFCLEAKHYAPDNGVGVKEVSRLISRIKHREFGVFVTTSYISKQAYEEVRTDGHPIVIMSGLDIANTLFRKGINTVAACKQWLKTVPDPRDFHGKTKESKAS